MEWPKNTQEVKKDPKRILSFLIEYNFGTKDEDAATVVKRFTDYEDEFTKPVTSLGSEYSFKNLGPGIFSLLDDELEKSGFSFLNRKLALKEVLLTLNEQKPLLNSTDSNHAPWS
jgi:hypothetical protein